MSATTRNRDLVDRIDKKLFRFAVVSQVITTMTAGQRCSDAVAAATALHYPGGSGQARSASRRSVYRWLAAYKEQGIAGLD